MKLIKLELKRTDFKGYLLAAAGISAFCLIMAFAFPLIPKMDERSAVLLPGEKKSYFEGEMYPYVGICLHSDLLM